MSETLFPIAPSAARYIKLGVNNAWFESCRANDRIEFGHQLVPHELASVGSRTEIATIYSTRGRTPSKASDYAREVVDFYRRGEDALWITFAEGCLWWAFAKPTVRMLGETGTHGERCRDLVAPWSNRNARGELLTIGALSTRLTKVSAYRQTICGVEAFDYLVRRINGIEEPVVAEARIAKAAMVTSAAKLIAGLHWRDFEVLCDLIFARSGWQRIAELGGLQKDIDLVIEQAATGERGFVQIKSSAGRGELADYVGRFQSDPGFDRMFFVCHSPKGELKVAATDKPIHVWAGTAIAQQAVAAGLFDWLVDKAA